MEYIRILVLDRRDPFFAKKYLELFKQCLFLICFDVEVQNVSEKKGDLLNVTVNSIINILLNLICNTKSSLEEIETFIMGLFSDGYYDTLTNKFHIRVLKNPF